jgi:hypothetical protein
LWFATWFELADELGARFRFTLVLSKRGALPHGTVSSTASVRQTLFQKLPSEPYVRELRVSVRLSHDSITENSINDINSAAHRTRLGNKELTAVI